MTDKSTDGLLSAALDTLRSNLKPGLWSEEEICQGCLTAMACIRTDRAAGVEY